MDLFRTQSYTHKYERKSPLTYSFLNTELQTSSFSKLSPCVSYTVLYIQRMFKGKMQLESAQPSFSVSHSANICTTQKKNLILFWLIYCACTHTHTPFRSQTALNIGSSDLFTVNHVRCHCAAAGMKLTCLAATYLDWWWLWFYMHMPPNAATATMIPCTTLQWDEQQWCV